MKMSENKNKYEEPADDREEFYDTFDDFLFTPERQMIYRAPVKRQSTGIILGTIGINEIPSQSIPIENKADDLSAAMNNLTRQLASMQTQPAKRFLHPPYTSLK